MSARNRLLELEGESMQKTDRAAAAVVAGIAAGAFTLSFEALQSVYLKGAGSHDLSVIYPLIVEGFVTVAVWVAYSLRDYGWKATAYPWTLAALFFAYSLWSNALPDTVPGPVIRGVPSLAVPLAVHLFTHLLKKRELPIVAVAELVPEEKEGAPLPEDPWEEWEEVSSLDDPWEEWEPPAVEKTRLQVPIVEKPPVAVAHAAADTGPLIREWARKNGFDVKETGRIPDAVVRAFMNAHSSEPAHS